MKVFSTQNTVEAQALTHHLNELGYETRMTTLGAAFGSPNYEINVHGSDANAQAIEDEILKFQGKHPVEKKFAGDNPVKTLQVIALIMVVAILFIFSEHYGISVRRLLRYLLGGLAESL